MKAQEENMNIYKTERECGKHSKQGGGQEPSLLWAQRATV